MTEDYQYLDLPGICDLPRGDSAQKLNIQHKPDTDGDLSVFFPDNRTRPIKNQFNQAPYCVAFIINNVVSEEPTVLIWSDEVELTISCRYVQMEHMQPTTLTVGKWKPRHL